MAKKSPMISRRWLINYVLILLIVVFTFIGNRFNVQTGYQPDNRISNLKTQDIISIGIQTADASLQLSKVNNHWQLDSPISWHANNISVERILNILNANTDSQLPSDEIDLTTLGLQFPKAMLSLNGIKFLFGATNNIGERRYLLTGDKVYLLSDSYLPFITLGINGLVDRRLLPRSVPLQSLTLGQLKLEKTDGPGWQANQSDATTEQINSLIHNWQSLEATQIRDYQSALTPRQKVTASLAGGGTIEFHVLAINPQIIIARPDLGLQYHYHENKYYGLLAPAKHEETSN